VAEKIHFLAFRISSNDVLPVVEVISKGL